MKILKTLQQTTNVWNSTEFTSSCEATMRFGGIRDCWSFGLADFHYRIELLREFIFYFKKLSSSIILLTGRIAVWVSWHYWAITVVIVIVNLLLIIIDNQQGKKTGKLNLHDFLTFPQVDTYVEAC